MGVSARFGSIDCISAQMSSTSGITPDVGTLVFPATAIGRVPKKGVLALSDGNGGSVQIEEVYAVEGSQRKSQDGLSVSVQVADRRLVWQWDDISFTWNRPNSDGTVNAERTLADLIRDLLMHLPGSFTGTVASYLVAYPFVDWQQENTARALQALCDRYGLIVSMTSGGRVNVLGMEEEAAWPGGPWKEITAGSGQVQKPAEIVIVGAPVVNEKTFSGLLPVGLEANGEVRPINSLSYKPAAGWGVESIACRFPNVTGGTYGGVTYTVDEARELAKKAIWKWYALNLTADERKQYLPVLDIRSEIVTTNGNEEHGKPYVLSENARWDGTSWKKDAKGRISTGFQIDNNLGIVQFEEPVYSITNTSGAESGAKVAPNMDLRAAYELKPDPATPLVEQVCTFFMALPIPGGVQGTRLVHKAGELREYQIEGVQQNVEALEAVGSQIAGRLAKQFGTAGPESRVYPAILDVEPRGAIRSVQWSVDGQNGATTTIQKNFDQPANPDMPTYEERLRRRHQKVVLETVEYQMAVKGATKRAWTYQEDTGL